MSDAEIFTADAPLTAAGWLVAGLETEDGSFVAVGVEKQQRRLQIAHRGKELAKEGTADAAGFASDNKVQANVAGMREQFQQWREGNIAQQVRIIDD